MPPTEFEPYQAAILTRDTRPVDVADVYSFRPDRRLPWLQRILFWALRRLGAHAFRYVPNYSVVDINLHRLAAFLRAYSVEVYKATGETPRRALVGWRTVREFAQSDEWNELLCHPQTFNFSSPGTRNEVGQYMGFTLYTLPWFERGVVLLPDEL